MTNQEASWVGLGWTLNPGAINRNVNGFPDDHKNVTNTSHTYWAGGEISVKQVGISVGLPGDMVSVSAGISVARNTLTGVRGVGFTAGIGIMGMEGIGAGSLSFGFNKVTGSNVGFNAGGLNVNMNSRNGVSGGVTLAQIGVSQSAGAVTASAGASVGINFKGKVYAGMQGGVSAYGNNLLGASLSTSGGASFTGVGSSASVHNSKAGDISTSSSSFGISIPLIVIPVNIFFGKQTQRFWLDEKKDVFTNGALFYPTYEVDVDDLDDYAYDTYSLSNRELVKKDLDNVESVHGGSFPQYDDYDVTGQGINGKFQPYLYEKHLVRQNKGTDLIHFPTGYDNNYFSDFRFVGDFSNRYLFEPDDFRMTNTGGAPLAFSFAGNGPIPTITAPVTGETGWDGFSDYRLYGSKHMEYFTNKEIVDYYGGVTNYNNRVSGSGLINNEASGFDRSHLPWDQIGAFMVTNESGVTYHYTLPACSYGEYMHSEKIDRIETFNAMRRPTEYTYTWHLTAVTGPDFVDRNSNGYADDGDWGYWVKLNYGKWTDQYRWRNPGTGYHKDLDGTFKNYSTGLKELYYLDAVETKTHTALFIKDIREDAHGLAVPDKRSLYPNATYDIDAGDVGYHEKLVTGTFKYSYFAQCTGSGKSRSCIRGTRPLWVGSTIGNSTRGATKTFIKKMMPTPSLSLKKILLLEKSKFASTNLTIEDLKASSNTLDRLVGNVQYSCGNSGDTNICDSDINDPQNLISIGEKELFLNNNLFLTKGSNVLDIHDYATGELESISTRVIDFETDYSLAKGTINSFDAIGNLSGKLTLKSVDFQGKGGESLIPPTRFEYDLDDPEEFVTSLTCSGDDILNIDFCPSLALLGDYGNLNDYDLVKVSTLDGALTGYYYYWAEAIGAPYLYRISGDIITNNQVRVLRTKNPGHDPKKYDSWGMYKPDLNESLCARNEYLARQPTPISAKNADVWSLRKITTPLGSSVQIELEVDSYKNISLSNASVLQMKEFTIGTGNTFTVGFLEDYDVEDFFKLSDKVGCSLARSLEYTTTNSGEFSIEIIGSPAYGSTCEISNYGTGNIITEALKRVLDGKNTLIGSATLVAVDDAIVTNIDVANNSISIYSPTLNSELASKNQSTQVENIWCTRKVKTIRSFSKIGRRAVQYTHNGAPILLGGFISDPLDDVKSGGGVRVASIRNISSNGLESETAYTYDKGVTSYEPFTLLPGRKMDGVSTVLSDEDAKQQVERAQYYFHHDMIANSREIPAPGVNYGEVTLKSIINDELQGSVKYNFQTFEEGMVGVDDSFPVTTDQSDVMRTYNGQGYFNVSHTIRKLKNYTAEIGSLKRIRQYDKRGSLITEQVNSYLSDELPDKSFASYKNIYEGLVRDEFSSQGVLQETFVDARYVKVATDTMNLLGTVSKYERYPSIMLGTTTANKRTGVVTSTHNLAYDFYSGQPVKTAVTNSKGEAYLTETKPAYRVYPKMGLKSKSRSNKNMLIQTASTSTSKVNPNSFDTKLGLVSASAQTWTNNFRRMEPGGYVDDGTHTTWIKESFWHWIGSGSETGLKDDGTYKLAGTDKFVSFNFANESANTKWQKNSEITLYDVYSHALEAKDVNGNFAATKMDLNQERVIATAANARYNEFAYSGVKDYSTGLLGGGVVAATGNVIYIDLEDDKILDKIHSGRSALIVKNGWNGFLFYPEEIQGKTYITSVWAKAPSVTIQVEGTGLTETVLETRKADGWYLIRKQIKVNPGGFIDYVVCVNNSGSDVIMDDFRFQPIDASVTAYAYNKWGELSEVLDNNNLFTRYEYDDMGRLKSVSKETFQYGVVQVSSNEIHYANQD